VSTLAKNEQQGNPVDALWYPDVAACGSLVNALRKAAREADSDVGEIGPRPYNVLQGAWMPSMRGSVLVQTLPDERAFLIMLSNNVVNTTNHSRPSWASGRTAVLTEVVSIADAWRGGMKLRELREAFPFMTYSRMALANEDGNVREVMWDMLIESEGYPEARPLLQAARADEQLGRMWAMGSHTFWVYFYPNDGSDAMARVHLTGGTHVVGPGGGWEDGDDSTVVHTVDEAVAAVKALLAGH
jgi:hypothetical protein